jgi:hypothetical protein
LEGFLSNELRILRNRLQIYIFVEHFCAIQFSIQIIHPVCQGCDFFDGFKLAIEVGEVIKSTVKSYLRNTQFVVLEHFAGVFYPDVCQKIGEGLAGSFLEISTKGRLAHVGKLCHII